MNSPTGSRSTFRARRVSRAHRSSPCPTAAEAGGRQDRGRRRACDGCGRRPAPRPASRPASTRERSTAARPICRARVSASASCKRCSGIAMRVRRVVTRDSPTRHWWQRSGHDVDPMWIQEQTPAKKILGQQGVVAEAPGNEPGMRAGKHPIRPDSSAQVVWIQCGSPRARIPALVSEPEPRKNKRSFRPAKEPLWHLPPLSGHRLERTTTIRTALRCTPSPATNRAIAATHWSGSTGRERLRHHRLARAGCLDAVSASLP